MTTKAELRNAIFTSDVAKGKSVTVPFLGAEIELRQPTVGDILANADAMASGNADENAPTGVIKYLIDYAYVPGTEEKVFEASDVDTMKSWSWSEDLQGIVTAMNTLMGVNVEAAEKN